MVLRQFRLVRSRFEFVEVDLADAGLADLEDERSPLSETEGVYKALAKTSATPGKTLLINHFLINDEWYIVDLPGYGYAKRSKEARDQLWRMIQGYVLGREQMTNLFVLVVQW